MDDQILSKILENSFTIHQLRHRVRILKAFISKKIFSSDTAELDLEIRNETNWLNSLGEQFFVQFNQNNFSQTFQNLEKKIESLGSLIIYFAFEPNQSELEHVGSWLRANYGSNFLFESKLDPSLIGGCAFVWKGVYRDYSLRAIIEHNSQAITEIIKQKVHTNQ